MRPTSRALFDRRVAVDMVLAVLVRPNIWWSALGALRRMAAPDWWRSAPYLPLPAPRLWAFRMVTAYGDEHAAPAPDDLVAYLEWCRTTSKRSFL